ncbi:TELO2 interacting protein 1 [Musa troglodytarum]|uniref:TELO2 interacting protein 1 n=1 Tax=Musa troglodytarum TaxID=320322 RepID=A0A9E7L4K5_9LILI|nr:TELO2 interacting protein 1 [Musa troglodytarum]
MFQMVVVLKKITIVTMHSEASEEFHVGIIRCLRVLNLLPCSLSSCSFKQMVIMPTSKSIDGAFVHHNTLLRNHVELLECLLAFLQSPNASAAEGHWLSLLLQVSCTCFVLFILFYCCIVTKCRIMFRASYTYILLLQHFKYLYIFLLNVVW